MTRKQLWNMKHALPRTSFLAIGIAAAGFFASPSAFAGQKEINAIQAALDALPPAGDTIATATAANLSIATLNAIDDPLNKKLSPTVIAGEALKGSGDDNFGTVFGVASFASTSARIADKNKFAAGAAVSASTGKTANATLVPTFASQFVTDNIGAVALAKLATKSNTAIGAILGGRALDADVTALTRAGVANAGIQDPKLAKAAQQIAQYVGDTVANNNEAISFAGTVASASPNKTQQVAVGVTTSNPTAADGIVDGLLGLAATTDITKKNAPKIAKAVGLVADVEQVSLLADTLGRVITSKQVTSTAKSLVQAISARPGDLDDVPTGVNSKANKGDEIGEIAAYFLNAVKANALVTAGLTTDAKTANFVFNLAKTLFKAAKVKKIKGTQTKTDLQALIANAAGAGGKDGYFAASFALTITKLFTGTALDAIKAKFDTVKEVAKIGGKNFDDALLAGFNAGFTGDGTNVGTGYEDGTLPGPVVDPETDTRNS